jgi:site-specific DNA-methyltransferase (adenine-specific)
MELMKTKPDNYYDLAIVDPPYGIGASDDDKFGVKFKTAATHRKSYIKKEWDNNIPDKTYFNELQRISKKQIIWGANYFNLPGGRLFWNKDIPLDYKKSKGELAYLSFRGGIDYIKYTWNGMIQKNMKNKEKRIHPTQKPVALYKWLLQNYAKPSQTIFDSHVGSGSIRIACHDLGFDFEGCELDKDYWKAQEKRYKDHISQKELFPIAEMQKLVYS